MGRPICFLLALCLAFFPSPFLYAQHSSGGGHGPGQFGGGGFSGHSLGHSFGQSFGHVFAHHSGREGSPFAKGPGGRGSEFPPLAGAALIHGKLVMLPGPGGSKTLDGQPRHTMRGQFAAAFVPHRPSGGKQFDLGFCDSVRFTWHGFWFPDDLDCFGHPFLLHRFFAGTFRSHFWSDSLFTGVAPGASEWVESPTASHSSGLAPRRTPSVPRHGGESSARSGVRAEPPVTLLQLRDGSMYGLVRYWVEGGRLHYITDYGGEDNVPLERIDFAKTTELNASRGATLILREKGPNP